MKPTVLFAMPSGNPRIGSAMILHPINHPDEAHVSNTKAVLTSMVVAVTDNDNFETENSIYKRKT